MAEIETDARAEKLMRLADIFESVERIELHSGDGSYPCTYLPEDSRCLVVAALRILAKRLNGEIQ
jgi:hypothetical protein